MVGLITKIDRHDWRWRRQRYELVVRLDFIEYKAPLVTIVQHVHRVVVARRGRRRIKTPVFAATVASTVSRPAALQAQAVIASPRSKPEST